MYACNILEHQVKNIVLIIRRLPPKKMESLNSPQRWKLKHVQLTTRASQRQVTKGHLESSVFGLHVIFPSSGSAGYIHDTPRWPNMLGPAMPAQK